MSSAYPHAEMPAAPAASGITPDYNSITDTQERILILFGSTFILATVLLALRLYTSLHLTKQTGWDAPLITLSWLATITYGVLVTQEFKGGLGRHSWSVTTAQLELYAQLAMPAFITYMWAIVLVKLSILVFFYRIDPNMCFRYCSWLVASLIVSSTIAYTVLMASVCNPSLGEHESAAKCISPISIAQAATNITTNLLMLAMPLHMTTRLQVPTRKKIIVGSLITLGSFVVIFPIIRTAFLGALLDTTDFTFSQASVTIWSGLELNFGIICACIPMLQPFVKHHMPWVSHIASQSRKAVPGGAHYISRAMTKGDESNRGIIAAGLQRIRGPRHNRGAGAIDEPEGHVYILHSVGRADKQDDASVENAAGSTWIPTPSPAPARQSRLGPESISQIMVTTEINVVSGPKRTYVHNYWGRYG